MTVSLTRWATLHYTRSMSCLCRPHIAETSLTQSSSIYEKIIYILAVRIRARACHQTHWWPTSLTWQLIVLKSWLIIVDCKRNWFTCVKTNVIIHRCSWRTGRGRDEVTARVADFMRFLIAHEGRPSFEWTAPDLTSINHREQIARNE